MENNFEDAIPLISKWLGAGSINIFGRQYAGKDTQCEKLAEIFGGVVLGGGDILRHGQTPQHVLDAINSGALSPTEEYKAIVTPYLSRDEFAGKPLFLSSVGRMQGEEEAILAATAQSGHEIKAVIFLDIDESTTWKRFHEAKIHGTREDRTDDDEEGLRKRLDLYEEFTIPVINRYRDLGLLIHIDGTPSIEQVDAAILRALLERATNS